MRYTETVRLSARQLPHGDSGAGEAVGSGAGIGRSDTGSRDVGSPDAGGRNAGGGNAGGGGLPAIGAVTAPAGGIGGSGGSSTGSVPLRRERGVRRQKFRRGLSQWFLWWKPLPRRPYWIWLFAGGAIAFHLLGFYWMRPFYGRVGEPPAHQSMMVYLDPVSQQSATLAEQSSLLDFEPLFLPTGWNAEPERMSVFDRSKRTEPYAPYGPEISTVLQVLPAPVAPLLPRSAQEALNMDSGAIFSTFGRNAADAIRLEERLARVQVESLSSLRPEGYVDVPTGGINGIEPGALGVGEFLIEVDATGGASLPLLRRSTGQDRSDRIWLNYLHSEVPVWDLGPGTYRLIVGP